jgi:hypothetical protein
MDKRFDFVNEMKCQRGGVVLRIIIASITLVVIGGLIFILLHNYQQKQQIYHRKALSISEYGLFQALQKIGEEPSWTKGIEKTPYEDGWYRVETNQFLSGDTIFLAVRSEGHIKSITDTKECVLRLEMSSGDSVWIRHSMH